MGRCGSAPQIYGALWGSTRTRLMRPWWGTMAMCSCGLRSSSSPSSSSSSSLLSLLSAPRRRRGPWRFCIFSTISLGGGVGQPHRCVGPAP